MREPERDEQQQHGAGGILLSLFSILAGIKSAKFILSRIQVKTETIKKLDLKLWSEKDLIFKSYPELL